MSNNIAFLGLGAMGFGMATNLLNTGHTLTGFDVYPPTLSRFHSAGGLTATTPRSTVKGAKYIIFMVATAAQANDALFDPSTGAVEAIAKDAVLLMCSTGPPEYVPAIQKRLQELGRSDVFVVDAPVSGGTIRAADGTLTILASGDEKALTEARPVLDAMAGKFLNVIPGGLGAGTKVKMVHQVLAGIHIVMASEAMGFAARLGLNTREVYGLVGESEGASWMFGNRGGHMIERDEKVYSALNIIVKDVGIVTEGGRSASFPLFLSSTTEQVLASGVSAGLGLIDDAGLVGVYLPKTPSLVLEQAAAPSIASTPEGAAKIKLVIQAMAGVHLVAAAEAMTLGARVGLDTNKLYEIISTAAGSSAMFVGRVPGLLSGEWSGEMTVGDVIAELTEAIEEANKMNYPLHLTSTALQLLQLAALRGLGKEPDIAVSKIWDGLERETFPRAKTERA